MLSKLARLDNVIPAVVMISLLTFSKKWEYKISVKKYLQMLLMILVTCFSISLSIHHFGWNIFYYPTFFNSLNLSYTSQPQFHIRGYMALAVSQIMTGLFFSHFLLFMVLAFLVFIGRSSSPFHNPDFKRLFLFAIMATVVIRFLLQPVVADRFYIAYYLAILILLVKRFVCREGAPQI